jgi:hypothetical protein
VEAGKHITLHMRHLNLINYFKGKFIQTLGVSHFQMSDSYITIVPANVTRGQVKELSQKTIDWLTKREIISNKQSDCVLGQDGGYPPGLKYKDIIEGDDFGLLRLKTNGLEVITARQVFDNGESGLEEINCPKCGANNIGSDWGKLLDSWDSGHDDKLKCSKCYKELSIAEYNFRPSWGFGEFGLTFWNWPSLTSSFLDDLKKIVGEDIKVIHGKR